MLSKSRKNLSNRTSENLGLQIRNNQSMVKETLITEYPTSRQLVQAIGKEEKQEDEEGHWKWCDFHKIPWHNTNECC
jgi:hypothetical protein